MSTTVAQILRVGGTTRPLWSGKMRDTLRYFSSVPVRVRELRERLHNDGKTLEDFLAEVPGRRGNFHFQLSDKARSFLRQVQNPKYSRGGKAGEGYVGVQEVLRMMEQIKDYPSYYHGEEQQQLLNISEKIQQRMRVKISCAYVEHALKIPQGATEPHPILKIVMPEGREIDDLSGETDPSNQNRYSPIPGLLHKYGEMLLAYVSINCSAHCRYCYRLDLFSGISEKSKADMEQIAAYIKIFNQLIDDAIALYGEWDEEQGFMVHRKTREPLLHVREILFSGGDPMTLPNATIARYMALMAEAGIKTIRFGTKELAFNPGRFDNSFVEMLDEFHAVYPDVRLEVVGHYVHPYELVRPQIDTQGKYIYDIARHYDVREDLVPALRALNARRDWIGHFNQFPIIAGVNDSPDILRLLMYQSNRLGITIHNVYACREIIGNRHFRAENTIKKQYELVEMAKAGLSGIENHGRLIMSTEYGKTEVVGVEDGQILLRLNRFVHGKKPENTIIRVDPAKLPAGQKFYWLTEDVIKTALSPEGQQIIELLSGEDNTFIKHLKKQAANQVYAPVIRQIPEREAQQPTKVTIEVIGEEGSRIIEVDLAEEKKKRITLATVLKRLGLVEAACDEQLSCSTCVGSVKALQQGGLSAAGEDELDLIDTVADDIRKAEELRAACQIPLIPGGHYRFTELELLRRAHAVQKTYDIGD